MEDPSENLVMETIQRLRFKLLDLTLRNPLIQFRHTTRGRRFLRVIDELPDQLFDRLDNDKELGFKSLGPKEEEPTDERTITFRRALEAAKLSDETYLKALQEAGADPGERLLDRLEQELRMRVRSALSMPPRPDLNLQSITDVAKARGLDPSFDLPATSATPGQSAHTDTYIQTLLFEDDLQRTLSVVRDAVRSSLDETGVNPLFCVFGFLEWFEAESSERQLHAPLLLLPLDIDRSVAKGRWNYRIRSSGENLMVNVALAERLKQDFGILLPPLEDDDTPEAYWARVASVVASQKSWKVRRWMTIGTFSFAKIAMYHDLDPDRWTEHGGLKSHKGIGRLAAASNADHDSSGSNRSESGAVYASDEHGGLSAHEADQTESSVPLIMDADSTQLAAIRQVLAGRSLVIEGPPGTGKSQTIANMIAAALGQGKTVLFIAEKMAALNVVRDRLAKAGLEAFCFELHSNKAGRRETYAALARRLATPQSPPVDAELNGLLRELSQHRLKLSDLVEALAAPAGNLGCTVQLLLWKVQACRAATSMLPPDIDGVQLDDDDELVQSDIDYRLMVADRYRTNRQGIIDKWGSVGGNPWRGLARYDLDLLSCDRLVSRVDQLGRVLRDAVRLADQCEKETSCPLRYVGQIAALAAFNDSVPPTEDLTGDLIAGLNDINRLEAARSFHVSLEQLSRSNAILARNFATSTFPEAAKVADAASQAQGVFDPQTKIAELSGVVQSFEKRNARLAQADQALNELRSLLSSSVSIEHDFDADVALAHAAVQASKCPPELIGIRTTKLVEEASLPRLTAAKQQQQQVAALRAQLTDNFVLADCPSAEELRACARLIRSASRLAFLSKKYHKAIRTWRGVCKSLRRCRRHEIAAEFDRLAEYRVGCDEFIADTKLIEIIGDRFDGMDTDLDGPIRVAAWAQEARRVLHRSEAERSLLAILLKGDDDIIITMAQWARALPPDFKISWDESTKAQATLADLTRQATAQYEKAQRVAASIGELGGIPTQTISGLDPLATELAHHAELIDELGHPEHDHMLRPALGERFRGTDTDAALLRRAIDYVDQIHQSSLPGAMREWVLTQDQAVRHSVLTGLAESAVRLNGEFSAAIESVRSASTYDLSLWLRSDDLNEVQITDFRDHCVRCYESPGDLQMLCEDLRNMADLASLGLKPVVDLQQSGQIPLELFHSACERAIYQTRARAELSRHPALVTFNGDRFDTERARFRELDKRLQLLRRREIIEQMLRRQVPAGESVGPIRSWSDLALVQHVTGLQRPRTPIRQLLAQAGPAIRQLTPCFMMSPLSVAQYLPPDPTAFDLIIMDEASQLRPEDAMGAVARGKQVVIVGDPKQLPPTSFFAGSRAETFNEDDESTVADESSILDGAMTVLRPMQRLKWHYRSRHGSLIAYSNKEFYDNELIVFPSPYDRNTDYGVHFTHVPEGCYRAQLNAPEAARVAQAVLAHAQIHPDRSLGVVTLNAKQAELLRLQLDDLATSDSVFQAWLERYEHSLEPFFVKNLENVQGDERDSIFISTVYGKDEAGNMHQRFGPINNKGGHRRLNVLFTRAKLQTMVFSSMLPGDIKVDETTTWGRRALQGFLAYAQTRSLDMPQATGKEPDSDFERSVIGAIRDAGFEAIPQVGVVGYFVDIGVRHPAQPGRFALGIECDGSTYHSTKSARDRDRLRQEVLENLGWKIHRIWSLDWFRDPRRETERLITAIRTSVQS